MNLTQRLLTKVGFIYQMYRILANKISLIYILYSVIIQKLSAPFADTNIT
jgi:hypothetical protein